MRAIPIGREPLPAQLVPCNIRLHPMGGNANEPAAVEAEGAKLRLQMIPCSYLDLELLANDRFNELRESREA